MHPTLLWRGGGDNTCYNTYSLVQAKVLIMLAYRKTNYIIQILRNIMLNKVRWDK